MAHLCLAESLTNGALDLAAIAQLNDALDVEDENRVRIEEHVKRGR
jgi:hypothetical protein